MLMLVLSVCHCRVRARASPLSSQHIFHFCVELIKVICMKGNIRPGITVALKHESALRRDWMRVTNSRNTELYKRDSV